MKIQFPKIKTEKNFALKILKIVMQSCKQSTIIIRTFLNCVRSQNHHLIPSNSRIKEKEVNHP